MKKYRKCPALLLRAEWKENFFIDLQGQRNKWKDLHVRFEIYKHEQGRQPKLYGYSFLPLCTDGKTVVTDDVYRSELGACGYFSNFQNEKNATCFAFCFLSFAFFAFSIRQI